MTDLAGTQATCSAVSASYSREQERQADQGGMLYLVRAGYDPQGMVDLMRLLIRISGSNPSMIEQMFSSHPMSTERLETAETRLREEYAGQNVGVVNQAAFLAATASIRKNRAAFQHFAAAEVLLAQKQAAAAKTRAEQGLRIAPNDYVGLMLVAQAERQSGQIGAAQQTASPRGSPVSCRRARARYAWRSVRCRKKSTPQLSPICKSSNGRFRVNPIPLFTKAWPMRAWDVNRKPRRHIGLL